MSVLKRFKKKRNGNTAKLPPIKSTNDTLKKWGQNSPKPCRVWKSRGRGTAPRFLPAVGWRVGVGIVGRENRSVEHCRRLRVACPWLSPARSPASQRSWQSLLSILNNSFNGFLLPSSQVINIELGFPSESNFSGPEYISAESTVFCFCCCCCCCL